MHRFEDGVMQADRIAINFIGFPKTNRIIELINLSFYNYTNLKELFLFKGSRLISIKRDFCQSKNFKNDFCKLWAKQK